MKRLIAYGLLTAAAVGAFGATRHLNKPANELFDPIPQKQVPTSVQLERIVDIVKRHPVMDSRYSDPIPERGVYRIGPGDDPNAELPNSFPRIPEGRDGAGRTITIELRTEDSRTSFRDPVKLPYLEMSINGIIRQKKRRDFWVPIAEVHDYAPLGSIDLFRDTVSRSGDIRVGRRYFGTAEEAVNDIYSAIRESSYNLERDPDTGVTRRIFIK